MALYFSSCILSLCLPLLTHTPSYIIHLLMTYNYRCLLPQISELLHSMQSCISDVKAWATANMFKLSDNKTELMLFSSKRTKNFHNLPTSVIIGNAQIPFKQSVKNLGFTLDCYFTMNAHVTNITQACYFELRRLASSRRFLTSTATATIVSSLDSHLWCEFSLDSHMWCEFSLDSHAQTGPCTGRTMARLGLIHQ